MPFVQLGVRLDDLWVLQESVAEVVHYGGNGEDATQTFIKSWFCHDFVLLWVCVLDRYSSNRYSSREPTISGIQALRNLFSPTDGPSRRTYAKGFIALKRSFDTSPVFSDTKCSSSTPLLWGHPNFSSQDGAGS